MRKKLNKLCKKLLSAVLASAMVVSSAAPAVAVQAEEAYPDISAVISELDGSEVVKANDIEFEAGDNVNVEKEGLSYDAEKVTVKMASAKDAGGASYQKDRAGTYSARYNCTPRSGAPAYSVTRKITVREAKAALTAAPQASDAQESHDAPAQEEEAGSEDADADSDTEAEPEEESVPAESEASADDTEETPVEGTDSDVTPSEEKSEDAPAAEDGEEAEDETVEEELPAEEEAAEEEETVEEEEEIDVEMELLKAIPTPLGNVTVGRTGRTPLPGGSSEYVNYTRCWWVKHNGEKYWAVCARASASGPVDPQQPDSATKSIKYNYLKEDVINGLAAWYKKYENDSMVPVTKGLGYNVELAKAVMVSMFVRDEIWEDNFSSFTQSYAAAHLLISKLLFGDDNRYQGQYDLIFNQMKAKVEAWMQEPVSKALLETCTAYIAYRSDSAGRQPVMWVENIPGVLEVKKSAVDESGELVPDFDYTGTVYTVYKDADCTIQAEDITGAPAEFVIKADGTADKLMLPIDYYYIKETAAAPGLQVDTEVYETELVRPTEFGENMNYVMLGVSDLAVKGPNPGSLEIEKVDAKTRTAQGGATLEGAKYEIVVNDEDGIEALDGENFYEYGEVMFTITTNSAGRASVKKIPVGKYIIREKTPSVGYQLSKDEVEFEIEEEKLTSLTGERALKEVAVPYTLGFVKNNSNAEAMANVEFELKCKESGATWTVKTNDNGIGSLNGIPYGTYVLTEKECDANKGYTLAAPIEFSTKDAGNSTVIDLGIIVNKKPPVIGTVLATEDGMHSVKPQKNLKLIDTVSYSDMIDYVGKPVTFKGTLIDKETGKEFLVGGKPVTAETTVTLTAPKGQVEVEFIFDASAISGHALVAFESALDANGEVIAKHEDKNDRDQTVWAPSIETDAKAEKTGDNVMPESGSDIIDTVTYHALNAGEKYTLKAELYDADTKTSAAITGEAAFTAANSGDGSVDVTLKLPEGFDVKGKTFVVVETLFDKEDKVVADHKDLTDERQTVYGPTVKTNATDKATGDHVGTVSKTTTLVDRVTYTNLVIGKEYTVSGSLHNKATGEELLIGGKPVTAEKTFKADKKNGTIDLEFVFDSSALAGKSVVVFESLKHENIEVAAHADINDRNQTVSYPEVKTTATDKTTGTHTGSALDEKTTITDAVLMEGLVAGQKYSTKAVLMDKAANAPLAGGAYTKTIEFTAEAESQTINVEFEVMTSDVIGKSVVAFETLYHNDKEVAVHADINDENQTVEYPSVETTAVDSETKDHVGTISKTAKVEDLVEYTGLIPGKEYEIVGTLYDQETGKALTGADGNKITASQKFTPAEADGSVLITFTLDSTLLAGKSVVAFEDVYEDEKKVAVHADINDKDQTVSYPEVGTKAADNMTGDEVGTSDRETATIVDTVSYNNLIPGQEYTVKGTMMVKSTGKALVADGKEVTAEKTFTADKADGTIAITFTFDASALKGETVVAFETLYHKEIEVAAHADINDKGQSITYPGVETDASDIYTKDHVGLVSMIRELFGMPKTTSVVDKVTYKGLIIGKEYKVAGTLMNKETGEPVLNSNGEKITAEKTFKADKTDGTIELVFEVESELLAGNAAVVFEDLYHNDVKVAVHADITDKDQTVNYPDVSTTAKDKDTDDNVGTVKEEATIIDTVQMTSLVPGQEYTVKGTLHAQESGDVITLKDGSTVVEKTFTADGEEQSIELEFVIDSTVLEGKAVVVFEDLYHNDVKVAVHADLEDKNQTINYPEVRTNASDEMTGDEVGRLGEEVTVIDTVSFKDLIAGKEYTVSGTLMNKATGEPVLENGEAVTAEKTFTAETANGTIDITFTFNSSLLAGESVVAFEKLLYKGIEVAAHADINDKDQTVNIPEIGTKAIDGRTKTQTGEVTTSAILEDTVEYKNLVPGKTYTVNGRLVLKSTGEETGAVASAVFVPEEADGSIVLTFEFDSSAYAGDTVVAFETLLHNDVEIAVHADIEDEDQSVHYPEVTTDAKDGDTETHTGARSETATVVDVVTYKNLIVGKEYTVSGILMDQETGEPMLDEEGNEITAETTFTAEETDGTVELIYTLDSTLLAGKTVVVFEDLYHEDVKVASHADIEDENQTVHYPDVCTHAYDTETQMQGGKVGEEVSVTDMVEYENLVPGDYIAVGTVVDRETGEVAVDADGNEITARALFSNTELNGSVPVTFTFNSTGFDAKTVVVFQSIYMGSSDEVDGKGILVAEHNDIDDEAEMIFYPGVETNATDGLTKNHAGAVAEETTVIDEVTYHNLIPGKEYTVSGILMNKETEEPVLDAEGNEITASVTFTAEEAEGTVELVYTLDSTLLAGKSVVVFEDLYYEGIEIASHADIEDEDQTVHYPEIGTKASIGGKKTAQASGTIKLDDIVEYKNLVPGTEYTVVGVLMDKNGKSVLKIGGKDVTAKTTFVPETANGTVTVTFEFKASGLGGKTLVAFEYLYSNEEQVTCHADLHDEDQTVKLTTPPSPPKTGDESNMLLWGALAVAAAIAAACAAFFKARKRAK